MILGFAVSKLKRLPDCCGELTVLLLGFVFAAAGFWGGSERRFCSFVGGGC
jgi:hypothetical protein